MQEVYFQLSLRNTINLRIILIDMFKTKRDWIDLIVTVAILGAVWIFFTRVPVEAASATTPQPRVNFPAPALALATLDGKNISLTDLRGQVVLVNFWATWCPPCRAEMPEIQNAYDKYRAQNFTVLAVDVAEDEATIAPFVQEFKLTFPILLDRDTAVSKKYSVLGLPTSFFIGRDGTIRAVNLGAMNRAYIESQLAPLLEAKSTVSLRGAFFATKQHLHRTARVAVQVSPCRNLKDCFALLAMTRAEGVP